ncbi:hypothetical protein ACFL3H_00890 [Gemmatimonadota bacterium]
MQPETASPLDNPLIREGVEYQPMKEGAVFITGPGLDAFIIDDGTATVLQICDGRSLPDLCEEINSRYGWGLEENDVKDILKRWVKYGYLEGSEVKSRRMVTFDPAGLLRVVKPFQYLYGRRWVGITALLLAATGFVLTFAIGSQLITGIGDLARLHLIGGPLIVILGYYLGYSVTAFFHELGHALAIRRFEGEVPEIGIQRNFNFYVLSNRDILLTPGDRIWYYAGGLLSDTVWWVGAWIWWILAPGPVPLFLLLPQTVYFLVYAYAPSGSSDMAMILREAVSWKPLVRMRKAPDWRERWRAAPFTQVALEVIRLGMALFLLVFTAVTDWLLLVLYVIYRIARKGLNRL